MSPSEQYSFVLSFNWDDGFEPVKEVLLARDCSLETALLAFWRAEGPWLYIESVVDGSAHTEFVRWLSHRILSGQYPSTLGGFDPRKTECVSKTQLFKLRKAGLPEVFLGRAAELTEDKDSDVRRS